MYTRNADAMIMHQKNLVGVQKIFAPFARNIIIFMLADRTTQHRLKY